MWMWCTYFDKTKFVDLDKKCFLKSILYSCHTFTLIYSRNEWMNEFYVIFVICYFTHNSSYGVNGWSTDLVIIDYYLHEAVNNYSSMASPQDKRWPTSTYVRLCASRAIHQVWRFTDDLFDMKACRRRLLFVDLLAELQTDDSGSTFWGYAHLWTEYDIMIICA